MSQHILFLCTGNYYRSRFAEEYLRFLVVEYDLNWNVSSRGLRLSAGNVGAISSHTIAAFQSLRIDTDLNRFPIALCEDDLRRATRTIAIKETEHRPLMRAKFPEWEHRIDYWEVHDIDVAPPDEALPVLKAKVEELVFSLPYRNA